MKYLVLKLRRGIAPRPVIGLSRVSAGCSVKREGGALARKARVGVSAITSRSGCGSAGRDRERRRRGDEIDRRRGQVMQDLANLAAVLVVGDLQRRGRIFEDRRRKATGKIQLMMVQQPNRTAWEQHRKEAEPCGPCLPCAAPRIGVMRCNNRGRGRSARGGDPRSRSQPKGRSSSAAKSAARRTGTAPERAHLQRVQWMMVVMQRIDKLEPRAPSRRA